MRARFLTLTFIVTCFTVVSAQARYQQQFRRYGYVAATPPAIASVSHQQVVGPRPVYTAPNLTVQSQPIAQFKSRPPQLRQYDDGVNLYQYCKSDPVNYVDPWGLKAIRECDCLAKRVKGKFGHEWLECGGSSWGFYPPGIVSSPDPHRGKHRHDELIIWGISKKRFGRLKYGSKKGTKCKCASCSDIMSCISDYARYAHDEIDYGIWGVDGWTRHYTCRTFVKKALSKCCLYKSTTISR